MENQLDELTRDMAAATSRREALRRLGGFVGGALLASMGLDRAWAQSRAGDPCKAACRRCSPMTRTRCLNACYACPSTSLLCGPCGSVVCCGGGSVCSRGRCVCPPGMRDCGGYCADLRSDPYNCGACGRACAGGKVCSNGVCGCPPDLADCGGTCVYLDSDPNHCGACGNQCAAGFGCCGGVCTNLTSDPGNCGGCGYNCSKYEGSTYCCGGYCTDLTSDAYNCGACGQQCSDPAAPHCLGGFCGCATGTVCSGVCTILQSDPRNCGACGNACSGLTPACLNGFCSPCLYGLTHCAGRCVNTDFDTVHCGGCGIVCGPGETCTGGRCQPAEPPY